MDIEQEGLSSALYKNRKITVGYSQTKRETGISYTRKFVQNLIYNEHHLKGLKDEIQKDNFDVHGFVPIQPNV